MRINKSDVGMIVLCIIVMIAFANSEIITISLKNTVQVFTTTFAWISELIGSMEPPIPSDW